MKNKTRLIIISICSVVFIVFSALIFSDNITWFDTTIYNIIVGFKSDVLTTYLKVITAFANPDILIILSSISLLTLIKKKKYSLYLIGTLIISTIFNQVLKHLIARPRPVEYRLITETGYSFPSGHAMGSVTFYGFLIFLIINSNISPKYKWIINILLTFIIVNICLSRIYLGVHYASDILCGALLSTILLLITTYLIKKYKKNLF